MKGWTGDGGRQIGHDDAPRFEIELDPIGRTDDPGEPEPAPARSRRTLVVAATLALAAVLGAALLVSRDRVTGDRPETLATRAPAPPPAPTVPPTPTPVSRLVARTEATVDEPAASMARRQLSAADASIAVAYLDTAGVTFLRFSDGQVFYPTQTSSTYALDAGVESVLLRTVDGGPTYGISERNLDRVEVMNATGIFAITEIGGVYALSAGPDQPDPEVTADALVTVAGFGDSALATITLPTTLRRTSLDGLGIVTYGAGEGSRLIRPDGITQLSDQWVIAGNDQAWLEASCLGDQCALELVRRETGERIAAPPTMSSATDTYVVAPDGSAVVHLDGRGAAALWPSGAAEVVPIADAGVNGAAWSPDATRIVWLDRDGAEPFLSVWQIESRSRIDIDLHAIGAPSPRSPAIAVFTAPED